MDDTTFLSDVLQTTASNEAAWRPVHFQLPRDSADLRALLESNQVEVIDRLAPQLSDLLRIRSPGCKFKNDQLETAIQRHIGKTPLFQYGTWVYFPWTAQLVHALPEVEFREVRSSRNQYKILPAEQQQLRTFTIGIVGLSVGQATALTLAMEGVGGRFRLADFDQLDLSNMNRLTASVADLGINKAHLAARQMFQVDPYLQIEVFDSGITDENIEEFLGAGGQLDLLVEECDDPYTKLRLRECARDRRIPVLMETSDRGMLDVERFDLEPQRPILHGRFAVESAEVFRHLDADDKLRVVLDIVDAENASDAVNASLFELDETICAWPQLASSVALGGALVTETARRILLNQFSASGRFYVDLESLISENSNVGVVANGNRQDISDEASQPRSPVPVPSSMSGPVSREEIEYLVANGVLAPSGGNTQPWRFLWDGDRLQVGVDPDRISMLDFECTAAHIAIGAAVQNVELSAAAIGLKTSTSLPDESSKSRNVVCELFFDRTSPRQPKLFDQIHLRCTNRRNGLRVSLTEEQRLAISAAAQDGGSQLLLLEKERQLSEIGDAVGRGDRFRFFHERLHRELIDEIRWTREEVESTRDGIDLSSLELPDSQRTIMRLMASKAVMQRLKQIGGGNKLITPSAAMLVNSSAVGLLGYRIANETNYFQLGKVMQRIWLTATSIGLTMQPMFMLPFLFRHLNHGNAEFSSDEQDELLRLRERYRKAIGRADADEMFVFRLAVADAPMSAVSLRRPVADVLTCDCLSLDASYPRSK